MENDFFERVWGVVAEIPLGKVTTYGHIASYLGANRSARAVGWAMQAAVGSELPCHRVVNRKGELSGKHRFETPYVMEERLRAEGVTFDDQGSVNLKAHLWVPGNR